MLVMLVCASMNAQRLRFMPQWTPQAQFAGYYVALEKGFYQEEGVEVDINHMNINSRKNTLAYLKSGDVDIVTMQLMQAMTARDAGTDVVNVLQTSQNSGLCCVGKDTLTGIQDLHYKKVGVWKSGFGEAARLAAEDAQINVQWIPYSGTGVNLFLSGAVDAFLVYSYNELIQYYLATGDGNPVKFFRFSDIGYNYPEDGVYVMEDFYQANQELVKKFVKASKRGWEYAAQHREEALDITMKYITDNHVRANKLQQKLMLDGILDLQKDKNTGKQSFAPVSRKQFSNINFKGMQSGLFMTRLDYDKLIMQ